MSDLLKDWRFVLAIGLTTTGLTFIVAASVFQVELFRYIGGWFIGFAAGWLVRGG